MRSLVTSIFLYACDSWTLTVELKRKIQATEMRYYRSLLYILCKDRVSNKEDRVANEEVRANIQLAIGPHEDLLIMIWTCIPFIRFVRNHLARHSESGKKTRPTEEEMGRQHQGIDRPGARQVPEGSGELKKKEEETGCEIICGAPTTLAVKG